MVINYPVLFVISDNYLLLLSKWGFLMVVNSLLALIGKTPVVEFEGLYIKLEGFNLTGSIKDRPALRMIEGLEKDGILKHDDVIVEPTSGNTGISLAAIGAIKGYKVILVMPETMSKERRQIMNAYGAQIILTPSAGGMEASIIEAKRLVETKGYIMPSQFTNYYNTLSHIEGTAQEIINDFAQLDYVVAGIGTGGTISGLGYELKKHYPNIKIVGVEPAESPFLSKGERGLHSIQGIGAGFIPDIYNPKVVDTIEVVLSNDAKEETKRLSKKGLFVGISSGAAILVASRILKTKDIKKVVLVISPDSGHKYLSTNIYE